jgi:uncharacterized iron-regulated membrane protein
MSARASTRGGGAVYAAIWRWHFIAGLIVLPVLTLLAVTGGLYLFKPEIDHLVYRRFEDVPARAQPYVSADRLIGQVQAATGGRVLQFTPADRPDRAVRLLVRAADGKALTAFADPYDGRLIGTTHYGGVMQLIRKIHSLQKFGFWASLLVETAAGWAIVMVLTGVYLWWPRMCRSAPARGGGGRGGGVVTVRAGPRRRVFWRDLHAVTGAFTGAVILFLAVTGMPWSMVWGDHVQRWVTAANLYEPKAPAKVMSSWMLSMDMPARPVRAAHPMSQPMTMSEAKPDLPWALEKAPQPTSAPSGGRVTIPVDAAVAALDRLGLKRPYSLAPPDGPDGAFVGDYRPDRVENSRTVYLDQYSGRVLKDVGFKDWGPAAKAIEWGVAVHQGQEYGPVNRYVMLAGCLAIVLLSVTSVVMWWKRRPAGRLAVPPAPADRRGYMGLAAIVAPLAILYPLVGASILIGLALDVALRRLFNSVPSLERGRMG